MSQLLFYVRNFFVQLVGIMPRSDQFGCAVAASLERSGTRFVIGAGFCRGRYSSASSLESRYRQRARHKGIAGMAAALVELWRKQARHAEFCRAFGRAHCFAERGQ